MLLGKLVSTVGLDQGLAFAIVGALSTGGYYAVAAAFPFILPFLLTLNGLLATAGTAAVVAY